MEINTVLLRGNKKSRMTSVCHFDCTKGLMKRTWCKGEYSFTESGLCLRTIKSVFETKRNPQTSSRLLSSVVTQDAKVQDS